MSAQKSLASVFWFSSLSTDFFCVLEVASVVLCSFIGAFKLIKFFLQNHFFSDQLSVCSKIISFGIIVSLLIFISNFCLYCLPGVPA